MDMLWQLLAGVSQHQLQADDPQDLQAEIPLELAGLGRLDSGILLPVRDEVDGRNSCAD
jgi:hypothetical protein